MKIKKEGRFETKLDLIFWFSVLMLPIFTFFVIYFRSGEVVNFWTYLSEFTIFPFISDTVEDVCITAFGSVPAIMYLVSYFVQVEICHLLVDVLVFIPRMAHKFIHCFER